MGSRASHSSSGSQGPADASLDARPAGSASGRSSALGTRLAGAVHAGAGHLGLWLGLLICAALFLGWCGIAVLLSRFVPEQKRRRVGRRGLHRMFRQCLRLLRLLGLVEVDNAELLALREERSLILAPNHPSMMDVLLVISQLDDVGCIMKAELWDNVFLGAGARLAEFIRNDSPHRMTRLAVNDLQRGSRLLIFPEATRTVRSPVNPLSGGFALIAKKADAPIQTILIETDSPYLRKGWPLFRRPPLPVRFRLRLGRRFQPQDDVGALVADVEQYFIEQLGSRREPPLADSDPQSVGQGG